MGPNPKVEAPNELVVEGILETQGPDRRVNTDARTEAVPAAGLAPRARRIPQHSLPAVQICAVVEEQSTLHIQRNVEHAGCCAIVVPKNGEPVAFIRTEQQQTKLHMKNRQSLCIEAFSCLL